MAIVTRYFSTAAAGAGDGTSWADRAQLHNAGTWSTVITGFDFSGSDSLKCLIGPGTYTISTNAMASGLFANPPTAANLLFMYGCDGSGNELTPPDPDWKSNMPAFDDSTFPVLATTTNIATSTLALCSWYCVKFTASGRNSAIVSGGVFNWISLENSTANSAAIGVVLASVYNSVISMTGSSYAAALQYAGQALGNVLLVGVAGSSGNRYGYQATGSSATMVATDITVRGFGGAGVISTSTNVAHIMHFKRCTIANNAGDGIQYHSTASQTGLNILQDCQITGNGGYNVNAQSAARVIMIHCRARDGTSGNFNGFGNYPTDTDNYTTDSDDATEYVDSAGGDFQIKTTAATWGMGFGVSDEIPSGGGGGLLRNPGTGGGLI